MIQSEPNKSKKFPDLSDNLWTLMNDFRFSETDIGTAYINFLTDQRPGRLLSQITFTNAPDFERKTRTLKREIQLKTREYFSNLKINMKYEGATVNDLVKPVFLDEVMPNFSKLKANSTIEGVVYELLDLARPISEIGSALYAGAKKYTDQKPIIECRIPFKLFLEYNRIYSALNDMKKTR